MTLHERLARSIAAVVALGPVIFAAFAGCNANVETVCYDGPCEVATTTTTTAPTTSVTAGPDGDFPCDVFKDLQTNCHVCHNADHLNGAPIDLLTCGRFQETDCGGTKNRYLVAQDYVKMSFMPLNRPITDADKKTLLDWFAAGAACVPKGSGCTGTAGSKMCYQ